MSVLIEFVDPTPESFATKYGAADRRTMPSPTPQAAASPYAFIRSLWGLYDVELQALRIALGETTPPGVLERYTPYSREGDVAFRTFLALHARYVDAADDGRQLPFSALLLGSGEVFRANVDDRDAGPGVASHVTTTDLLLELDRLVALFAEDLQTCDVAHGQALILRDACRAAMALNLDLHLKHIADGRPFNAPIYEYTAGVEGFTVIQRVKYDPARHEVVVWLASSYVYAMSCDAIRIRDEHPGGAVAGASAIHDGAALRVRYDDGATSDWSPARILSLCEPLYFAFDEARQSYRLNDTARLGTGCRRVAPVG